MRAAVLYEVGKPLEVLDDISIRAPGAGEVRVRLAASGVCHSDVSFANGTLGATLPAALGHEGAGVVEEVGGGVTALAEGDHVILSWVPPCGECITCLGGQPFLCTAGRAGRGAGPALSRGGDPVQSALGVGSFGEQTVVPAAAAIRIPKDVPFDVASLVGCGVMTGVGAAINTARIRPGSSVLVIGCGGVGINVIQGAQVCGAASIVAMDRIAGKRDAALDFGATEVVADTQLADAVARTPGGLGFDYAFEAVGRSETIRAAWDATRRGGTTVVVGAGSARDTVAFTAGELFGSSKRLLGCVYGSADVRVDFARVLSLWRAGRLDLDGLVSRRIDLAEVNEAFSAMQMGDVLRSVICY
jgi:S-(hydroxymethyl)glutathione dehydrogenase/alcohol dehydrogenase